MHGSHEIRSSPLSTLLIILLLMVPGAQHATSQESPHLDQPSFGDGKGEVLIAEKDQLESEKISRAAFDEIRFRNGLVLKPEPGLASGLALPLQGVFLLQFSGNIRLEWIQELSRLGVTVHDHVQGNVLIAGLPVDATAGLKALMMDGALRHIGRYPADAKIDASLDLESGSDMRLSVLLVEGALPSAAAQLERLMILEGPSPSKSRLVRGSLPGVLIRELAALQSVLWIEPYIEGKTQNLEAAMSAAVDDVHGSGLFDGTGVRVAVDDSGITRTGSVAECGAAGAAYHPDLASTRIADEWDFANNDATACDDDFHGTHVAGTIAGDGTTLDTWTGMAPDVTLLIYKDSDANGSGFGNFEQVLSRAASHDADVVANSWGGGTGGYFASSFYADRAVRGYWNGSDGQPQRMAVTVSSGNENDLALAPATGKNVIAVGAMKDGNYQDIMGCWGVHNCTSTPGCACTPNPACGDRFWPAEERICFSNYGPIDTDGDGNSRIKPDVMAPGTRIMSTAARHLNPGLGLYRLSDGTSMAQPVVAGVVALMIDAYPSLRTWPEMTKARLLGSAIDLGDRNLHGHGMVDALHAIYGTSTMSSGVWAGNTITGTGLERDHTFSVAAGFSEVRVYLTWSDMESATTEVVNDLDLRVYDGAGALVASSATYDDTVEFVRLASGTPGTWRANVRGFNVPQPTVRYGIYSAIVSAPPSLSVGVDPNAICAAPGDLIDLQSTLANSGHAVAASETILDLPAAPSDFTLQNVEVFTDDPVRSHIYQAGDLRHNLATNEYSLYQGMVDSEVSRVAAWRLQVLPTAPEGSYPIYFYGTASGQAYYGNVIGVEVDATAPGNVTNLVSTTHPAGTCWKQEYVWMAWDPAADTGCGVDGYGVEWTSNAPASPSQVKDLEESTTFTFEQLAESANPYYFNIRSLDNGGNWAPSYESYGPMWVDTTAPGDASALGSETHPVGVCTDQGLVHMNWSAAADDNCGLQGYSVAWSLGFPASPDETMDLGPATQYEETLSPATSNRYFNIRSVDAAGNWAPGFSSYGPFQIDEIPAEVGNLNVEISGPDLHFWWDMEPSADAFAVYRSVRPTFSPRMQVGSDVTPNELWAFNEALGSEPIVYYLAVGKNVCGAEGP